MSVALGRPTYIAVAGNIGCGKSTLVDFICRTYGISPFFEPNAQNPYLADFYGDMKQWAFHSQLYFITYKFGIHMELDAKRSSETVVQDRTIYEDAEIFAANLKRRGLINARDWAIYKDLYRLILQAIHPPDLMIYLRASIRTMRKRIRLRGRPEEQEMPIGYLRSLDRLYEKWRASYNRSPMIVIDTDRLDYLNDLVHRIDVLKTIEKYV
jgi:deoxyadenosine/deoxycytidine kinase